MQRLGPMPPGFLVKFTHFFHLMALYSIVEFLLSGTMEFEGTKCVPITRQVRWASRAADVNDRMIPMYSAVALLLTASNDQCEGSINARLLTYV